MSPARAQYIIKRIGRDGIVGKIPLGKLAAIDIEGYFARLRLSGIKENTIKKDRQLLHAALKKAKKDRLLTANPAEDIDLEKIRKYKAATYAPEQIIEMLDAFSAEEIYIPTLLAVFTGLRRGEVLGLRWDDVDLEHGLLDIRQALHVEDSEIKTGLPKSEASESQVAIPASLIGELKRHHTTQKRLKLRSCQNYVDSDLVCTRLDGSPWNPSTFSTVFTRNLKYHGLSHIRFQDLRHSHATILHELGVDLKDISDRLRHSTLGITADL